MNYKKIRSKKIAERERQPNANRCPKCNGLVQIIPLSPTQSCKQCVNCQWTDFGKE